MWLAATSSGTTMGSSSAPALGAVAAVLRICGVVDVAEAPESNPSAGTGEAAAKPSAVEDGVASAPLEAGAGGATGSATGAGVGGTGSAGTTTAGCSCASPVMTPKLWNCADTKLWNE